MFKKRLKKNLYRSIILANSCNHWIYVDLFAKKNKANLEDDELQGFKKLARAYASINVTVLETALKNEDLLEICK